MDLAKYGVGGPTQQLCNLALAAPNMRFLAIQVKQSRAAVLFFDVYFHGRENPVSLHGGL